MFKKDLKLASRNPSYAMFLVLPVLGILVFTSIVARYDVISLRDVMIALFYSSTLTSLFSLTLMWSESKGVSVVAQLPVSTRKVVQAKSLAPTVPALSIPATLFVVSLFKHLSTSFSLLIAVIQIGGIYSGALSAATLLCALFGEGQLPSARIETHMLKYIFIIIISVIFIAAPMGTTGILYLLFVHDYLTITMIMGATTAKVIAVSLISKAALRDS